LKIARQNATQMALVEDDDVIQAFSADRTDETLNVRVLPGRSRRSDDLRDPVDGEFVNPRKNGAGAFGFSALARQVHPQHARTQGLRGQRLQKHNTTEARGLSDCLSVPPTESGLGAVAGARTNTSSGWGAIFGRIAKNV
jgi:hypothetical protein